MKIKNYIRDLTTLQYNRHVGAAVKRVKGYKAEDYTHETMIKLLNNETDTDRCFNYVCTSILNNIRKPLSVQERIIATAFPIEIFEETLPAPNITETLQTNRSLSLLEEAILSLGETQDALGRTRRSPIQTTVMNGLLQGLTLKEIAVKQNISYDTAKAHFRQASVKIRTYMKDKGYEHGN